MSIFTNMFKTSTPTTDTAPTVQEEKKLGESPATADASGKIPEISGTPVNPLDAYSKMFEDATKSSAIQAPSFKLDPKILGEVSATMDFTKGVQPDQMEKALAGDTKALLSVIQSVGRNAYSASLEHATSLTETHLGQRADYESKKLNTGVREQLTSNALSNAPNYDHPVVKAELNRVANQFAAANPDSSPQQIATAAQKYIADLSAALAPATQSSNANGTKDGEMDWSKYLS